MRGIQTIFQNLADQIFIILLLPTLELESNTYTSMPVHFSALRSGRFLPYPELKGIVSLEAEALTIHLRGRGSCGIGYLGTVAPWS